MAQPRCGRFHSLVDFSVASVGAQPKIPRSCFSPTLIASKSAPPRLDPPSLRDRDDFGGRRCRAGIPLGPA